jgi:hypothetical protein
MFHFRNFAAVRRGSRAGFFSGSKKILFTAGFRAAVSGE